jgi:hypothetical protein
VARIHVGELSQFYLCRCCQTIRETQARRDLTLTGQVIYHDLESADLPGVGVNVVKG